MENKIKIPYTGHPIGALIGAHFVMLVRSIIVFLFNIGIILPICFILLGPGTGNEIDNNLLSSTTALVVCLIAYLIFDCLMLGFRDHDYNLFHYDFVKKYGTHKLAYFNIYEFFVFTINLGGIAYSIYAFGNRTFFSAMIAGFLFPFVAAQISLIRGIKRRACKKCKRANILKTFNSSTSSRYEADYKNVGGYDTKVGEISYDGGKIDVIGHIPKQRVFNGISKVTSTRVTLVCPICGRTEVRYESYRNKFI